MVKITKSMKLKIKVKKKKRKVGISKTVETYDKV